MSCYNYQANYSWVPLQHCPIYHDGIYSIVIIAAEHKSDFKLTIDTPYLTFTGELGGVYCEDLGEKQLCYNGMYYMFNRDHRGAPFTNMV